VEDHHVDRPGVEVRQRMKLTGTNSSIGLQRAASAAGATVMCSDHPDASAPRAPPWLPRHAGGHRHRERHVFPKTYPEDSRNGCGPGRRGGARSSPAWWPLRGGPTRSHPELGSENPQRRWYCTLRCGRVGRCQACQDRGPSRRSRDRRGEATRHLPLCRPFTMIGPPGPPGLT
jgi:hypothetical protein